MMRGALFVICLLCLTACTAAEKPPAAPVNKNFVMCEDPRPRICTKEYRPVCATLDTGKRCVTTPCDTTIQRTYSNGCSACGDPKVIGYVPGPCPKEAAKRYKK